MQSIRKSKRTNENLNRRDEAGRFAKSCGAIIHETVAGKTSLLDLTTRRKRKRFEYDLLIAQGIITEHTKFIC